uniref:Epoxide hydrolase n=2 Tax=Panagrolaimus sp. JU765 TaxID=591449 RepID=A0AC34RAG9_9BILA
MGLKLIVLGFVVVFGAYFTHFLLQPDLSPVEFPKNGYFGPGNPKPDDPTISPFKINVSDELLDDLKNRLKNTRIGHEQLEDVPDFTYDVQDFTYGFNLKTLEKFKTYWLEKYDWRKAEQQLNNFPQFMTQIEGLKIHFIHAKPAKKYSKVIPLLMVHGWPGNVYEFYKIIPMLTNPNSFLDEKVDFAFEVIAPSIPGYGWSEASHKAGLDQIATARIFNKLMTDRLKFKKYMVQGGDWGSLVVSNIGRMYPENIYGVHVNMAFDMSTKGFILQMIGSYFPSLVFKDKESATFSMKNFLFEFIKEGGYMHIQATKPDTVGVGLNDSPIGLMT